jgi:hypothetical protein
VNFNSGFSTHNQVESDDVVYMFLNTHIDFVNKISAGFSIRTRHHYASIADTSGDHVNNLIAAANAEKRFAATISVIYHLAVNWETERLSYL